ncbi:MAG: ATP-binding cassette domain-containing protein [Tissierellia bacterium]|jgi:tungstate transport system ATP-binding protein|nr:ATP-binding cassette domain-containing protein [Tissierellia bacterium]
MKITIENLKKRYGDKVVLDIDYLEIESGKITGITGHNGSGKTTLLNIISGIDREYEGKVTYDGKILNQEIEDNMTYVFQKPYLFRRKSYDNIIYPLKLRKYDKMKIKTLLSNTIKNLNIEDLMNLKGNKLSGGETQKVALARALVFQPDLLLLDEFTSNIDPDYIKVMEKEVKRFNESAKATIIVVTHNIEQSIRLCDNIIHLNNGKVVV